MKQLFTAILLLCAFISQGQHTHGKVTYGIISDFEMEDIEGVPEAQMKRIRKRMEMMSKQKSVLVFDSTQSLFRNYDSEKDGVIEENIASEDGEMQLRIEMHRPSNDIYLNTAENKLVELKEFMGKTFLIKETPEKIPWKITGEQEVILNYPCQKAIWQKNDSTLIEAWFAPQIPVSVGPRGTGQLPGLIMRLNYGQFGYVAQEASFEQPKQGDIYEPKDGKKVSREKFKKIVMQKREEMREVYGNDGKRMMITH